MDTDVTGNHAAFNQNLGMWKSFGLIYRLLQNDIPVGWAIKEGKTSVVEIDISAASVRDKRTSTALGAWDYRGGPFIIDSADAPAALPIITAWWAANGNQPNVHEALAAFDADVDITLRHAPQIANDAVNAGITLAYFNAAGIPDSNGNPWSTTSPGVLDETEIANGGLFTRGIPCLERKYDTFVTPHNSGYAYSLTDPTNLGTRAYSELDAFVEQGGGWTALCHSILSNENNVNDLTRNGSPAVKALFRTSLDGGEPGGFLTTNGFPVIDNTGGTFVVPPQAADLPVAQVVPTSTPVTLPGGSVQTWPAPGNPGAPTYFANTERVAYWDTAGVDHDMILGGTYHNATGAGKLTYIGGHSFPTTVPYASNVEAPYLHVFYNSLFFNGEAVAKVDLAYSPTTYPENGTDPLAVSIVNSGGSVATDVDNVSIMLEDGFTYLSTTFGPAPTVVGQLLTWPGGLGDIAEGATAVTIQVAVDGSVSGTAGDVAFGTLHSTYGDIFGEHFTGDLCRAITVSPVPAPTLEKTPPTQGPVATGTSVTWTLSYGNTGGVPLLNAILEDTLPTGFTYVSSSASPLLPAPTVIPSASGTIVRWNVGTIPADTPAAGTVTITARAGAVTSGTGTPPQQTFTNEATLVGKDAGGTTISAEEVSASVVVEALDITLGKSVDKSFLTTVPGNVTYTLRPSSASNDPLENVRVIDPYPTGLTAPPIAVGQGGTFGAYVPLAAVPGHDDGPPVLDTAMTVGANFVLQGGSVAVTLNVKSSVSVPSVSPSDLAVAGGDATCTGPTPASATVPAGGAGVNFAWSCTLADIGEYVFSADAADAGATSSWPAASSASVLSAATGGPSVVAWNLGSTTAAVPGEILTGGYTAGIYGFRGADQTTFRKYGIESAAWTARANALGTVKQGGALTTDGAGTIYGLRGDGTQAFWAHDVATDAWTAKANTGTNVGEGGAAVFLDVAGTKYVYATMGNGTVFKRYDVAANTWATMTAAPNNIKKGGALTTDGTNIYVLRGDGQKTFFRYNVAANTWTTLAPLAANVKWGGSLTFLDGSIYALSGDGKKNFYRYNIGANTWTARAATPGNVAEGGALTNDGTFIYAFQGKTTAFWRYDVAANTWSPLAPFSAATNQGGALVFVPGLNPEGRFTAMSASRSLAVTGQAVTVTLRIESSAAVNNVVPGALTVTPTNGASCGTLTGPTLASADDDIADLGDPVFYQWTCTVAAGATPGSLTFGASATGAGPVAFAAATSNSVLVSPLLTFSATVPDADPNPIVDQALLVASGQTVSSPPVQTFIGQPVLTVVKSNSPTSDTTLLPGDPITYTMIVENVGVGDATNVVVSDQVPANTGYVSCSGGTSCGQATGTVTWAIGTLAPGDTATVSFTVSTSTTLPVSDTPYTISNTASATSTETPTPADSNTVTNELEVKPTIIKSVSATEAATGDTLTYTLTVSNPGAAFTADVSDVVPAGTTFADNCVPACTSDGTTVTWSGATINPGTSTFSFDVTVTAGGGATITNIGTLDPTSPDLAPIDSNSTETAIGPVLGIVKLNSPTGEVANGDTITYSLVINNESTVTAQGVIVTDAVPVGTSYVTCTTPVGTICGEASGVVSWQLGDIPGGATVTVGFSVTVGTPPPGTFQIANQAQVTAANAPDAVLSNVVYNTLPVPVFALTKTADPTTYDSAGDVITYSYVVTNNSPTVTIVGPVTVTDDKATVTCPAGNIAPLASMTCSATYTTTLADVDAGSVTNTAQAHSTTVANSNTAVETVTGAQGPALTIEKSITGGDPYDSVGDVIGYSYLVTNTGNVTVSAIAVSDDTVDGPVTCLATTLAPTQSTTCSGSYTVTQADLDASSVTNLATASGTPAGGTLVPPTDTETADATQTPALTIVKTADPLTYDSVGDVIGYSYLVTNTGNVTLDGPFTVSDDKASATCPPTPTSLAPLASITCTASYTVSQADLDAGSVTNIASATNGTVTSNTDGETVTAVQSPAIEVVKTTTTKSFQKVGDSIDYKVVATNTGNMTLTNVAVVDPGVDSLTCTPPAPATLAPGASMTCTGSHTVTQADVNAGTYKNTASASGNYGQEGLVTDVSEEVVVKVPPPAPPTDIARQALETAVNGAPTILGVSLFASLIVGLLWLRRRRPEEG